MTKLQVRIVFEKIESLEEQKGGGEDSTMRWRMQGVSRSVGRTFVELKGMALDRMIRRMIMNEVNWSDVRQEHTNKVERQSKCWAVRKKEEIAHNCGAQEERRD